MSKIKCDMCGHEISSRQFNRHKNTCNGLGPIRFRNKKGRGKNWSKGKTYEELFGEEKANKIKEKLRKNCGGTGRASTPEKEEQRKIKIAKAMKGNKYGATAFRRKKIEYGGIIFKSKWEANTAKFFDANEIDWKYENITYDLSDRTSYCPDFSIYENNEFKKHIEVKGYFREENKKKFDEFKRKYSDVKIELWKKEDLIKRGISTV